MGKGHTAVNEFLKKKDRFADFFNGTMFQGQRIILPEELELASGEADILVDEKTNKKREVHRYRDVVMRWKKEWNLAILACESQSKVHYAMPIRNMLYDGISYTEQAKELWQARSKETMKEAEYLSKFRKDDKLVPVITAVFHYGTDEWDASKDLYGMFRKDVFEGCDKLKEYVPNYHINLIEPDNMEHLERFQTDLKEIFGMMQCRKDKEKLLDYMHQNKDYFQHVDADTYVAIGELLQSRKIMNQTVKEEEEEEVDMCKALDDLYADGVSKGRIEGREEGREEGGKTQAIEDARRLFVNGADYELVRVSIPILPDEELQAIYKSVKG